MADKKQKLAVWYFEKIVKKFGGYDSEDFSDDEAIEIISRIEEGNLPKRFDGLSMGDTYEALGTAILWWKEKINLKENLYPVPSKGSLVIVYALWVGFHAGMRIARGEMYEEDCDAMRKEEG
jgi:hypothetical protein